ncbi:Armadillo-type fold [Pseudocohnilembus persalinus]|uniref:Armadillo-type fold n=1 Tax=Pseudocohnilembus persalinus TaxID=266149 RepID=A0A0V0R5H8_PSEPJ|nr:Armadillo-type fold [Pseudocohnilembus persalinus]|eukprot:KRX09724.1 Armadillo-type fold [Pseudocohnilembus persalinus]
MEQEQFTICDTIKNILTSTESELNKQAVILLESLITQVKKASPNIQEQQLPLAIFATLINLIQTQLEDYSPYLLLTNMLINRINVAVVKKLLITIQNQMVQIMKKDQKYQKYCIVILASTIQIVSKEEFLENDAHNLEIIKSIIESLWNENSLARKEAVKSIKMILEKKFFYKQQISNCLKEFIIENLETEDLQRIVFVTQFIQNILDLLPIPIIGDINYELMKALKSGNDEISTHIYLCIETIMETKALSVDLTESLLKEFLNNQPSFYKEEKVVQAYGQCMVQTLLHMNAISPKQAKKYITSCIAVLQEILLVENNSSTLPRFAQKSLEVLLESTIDSTLWVQKKTLEEELLDDFLKIEIDTSGAKHSIQFQRIIII